MKARFADGTNAEADARTERTAIVENLIVKKAIYYLGEAKEKRALRRVVAKDRTASGAVAVQKKQSSLTYLLRQQIHKLKTCGWRSAVSSESSDCRQSFKSRNGTRIGELGLRTRTVCWV